MHSENLNGDETQLISLDDESLELVNEAHHKSKCRAFNNFIHNIDDVKISRNYEIIRKLGRGRQGVVFEVLSTPFINCTTRHALKVYDPSLFSVHRSYDVEMVRIAKQTGTLQQLYHPNLVQCEYFYEEDGVGLQFMEMIDGIDIKDLLNRKLHDVIAGRMTPEQWKHYNTVIYASEDNARIQPGIAFYILRKMLRGLEVLHRTGYIHCDIKPSNVMIDRFGTVKLIDFGRATSIKNPGDTFLASPMYMAPEMHRREKLTPQVDLYSCGIILLEMLKGGPIIDLYSTEEEIFFMKRTLTDSLNELLPKELCGNKQLVRVIKRLLAYDPEERFQSAYEADIGTDGARKFHQELVKADLDTEYGMELESYLGYRLPESSILKNKNLG